jgi:uncharacterized repeat protein (TIGR03803 family)
MAKKSLRIFIVGFFVLALATALIAAGDNLTLIFQFDSKDGANPLSGVIADAAGNLYGTTTFGGNCSNKGCGVVFELSQSSGTWTETAIYNFQGGNDGTYPTQGLVIDSQGNLYGTTDGGGGSTACSGGCGTFYELSPSSSGTWTETILYRFTETTQTPTVGTLVMDASGNFYGVTNAGANRLGNIYELSPSSSGWTYTDLFDFSSSTGNFPASGVILDAAGNLYGTTGLGGDTTGTWGCGTNGCGVVYRLAKTSSGWTFNTLYVFHGPGGDQPLGGLIFDAAGNLYGTTALGGTATADGHGTVYKLSPKTTGLWKETILHHFTNGTDGAYPGIQLTIDASGSLYGVSNGPVFKLIPASSGGWQFEVIGSLSTVNIGSNNTPLLRDSAGNLYGTSYDLGNTFCHTGCGSVFELSPITTVSQ